MTDPNQNPQAPRSFRRPGRQTLSERMQQTTQRRDGGATDRDAKACGRTATS